MNSLSVIQIRSVCHWKVNVSAAPLGRETYEMRVLRLRHVLCEPFAEQPFIVKHGQQERSDLLYIALWDV